MNIRKNALLNTWGVLIYFFCQWILTVVATRVAGYEAAGRFSLALSFTNMFSFIGMFGMRGLQVSDVAHTYTEGQYYALRVVTCTAAILLFCVTLFFMDYSASIILCCVAMMAYKTGECILDVTLGTMQRREQFEWLAVSYTLRGIFPTIVFTALLLTGYSLPIAILSMTFVFVICFVAYDVRKLHSIPKVERKLCFRGTPMLLKAAVPLMLSALLDSAIVHIPRDAIERIYGSEALGYYSTVAIVTVVFSTLGVGIWGSITPRISTMLLQKHYSQLKRLICMVFVFMGVGSLAVLFFGNLLGPFFFKVVFGAEILNYMYLLTPVLVNALLLLINSFFQCLFIPMGKRSALLYTNLAALGVCIAFSYCFVEKFGIMGACFGLMLGLFLRAVLLTIVFVISWNNREKGIINE